MYNLHLDTATSKYKKQNMILIFYIFDRLILVGQTTDGPAPSAENKTTKKHVPDWLRFVLGVVLLLLSALVLLWAPPSSPPLSPSPLPPPTAHTTNGSLAIDIPDPQKVTEDVIEIDGNLIPHGPGVVADDKPTWPSPPPTETKGSWINFYWVKDFATNRILFVISLLLLAVLALCWPSMSKTKTTKVETVETKADLPSATQKQIGKDQEESTTKPGPSYILSLIAFYYYMILSPFL